QALNQVLGMGGNFDVNPIDNNNYQIVFKNDLQDAVLPTITGQGVVAGTTITAGTPVNPSTNQGIILKEVQSLGASPGVGTFRIQLTLGTQTVVSTDPVLTTAVGTAPTHNAVQSQLDNISLIGPGNSLVLGPDGGPFTIVFLNDLQGVNLNLLAKSGATG